MEKVLVLDNDNNEKTTLVKEFCKKNNFTIENINKNVPNESNLVLYTKTKDVIKDICSLHFVYDVKSCTITFPMLSSSKRKSRKLVPEAIKCACNLGAEDLFLALNPNDKKTINDLSNDNKFSTLGTEGGVTYFFCETTNPFEKRRTI